MTQSTLSRRGFLFGSAALGAAAGCQSLGTLGDATDPNFTVFLSDIHVSGVDASGKGARGQPIYQNALFEKAVDRVLALRPRPARVVVTGDIALWSGIHEDYEQSLPGLKRIRDAGIRLYLTMGNHDRRDVFLRYYPEYAKSSPVPGRMVSVVDLGTADLFLLDSLHETGACEGKWNDVAGALDDAQWEWIQAKAKAATRPFFVAAHHDFNDLGGRKMGPLLVDTPLAAGYIHGHHHKWMTNWFKKQWNSRRLIRMAGVPSTGWWGDIGFATLRTYPDRAVLAMGPENDFFFPQPAKPGEARPPLWDAMRDDHANARCTFTY